MKRGKLWIGSDSYLPLTLGKVYEKKSVYHMSEKVQQLYFYLDDDNNKTRVYDSWRFVSLEEWIKNQRENKLEELGI